MEIAVFSDIHGNYVAFEQCLNIALARGIDTMIFLGDYLGEFPYPQKTLERLYALQKEKTCFFLKGNKEDYWLDRKYNENCAWKDAGASVGAMHYCYEHLTGRDIDFFQSLPIAREIQFVGAAPIMACHGSPVRNREKLFPESDRTREILAECPCRYILCGHTHYQGEICHGGKTAWNAGAVGVPLHSGGRAQFLILRQSGQEWEHEFVAVDYDRERVIRELRESGLEERAPYWTRVTKHLIRTGEDSHVSVLSRAMRLCEEDGVEAVWYSIPERYWEQAVSELVESKSAQL